jgi:hypothetical protein
MKIAACRPYHARVVHRELLRIPEGCSVFKVYLISILGRDDPTRFEWAHCPLSLEQFRQRFVVLRPEGVGFVTAFPHITKVFRFAPTAETVLHVRAFRTTDFSPLDLSREDSYLEFACYAEAAIAADEYHCWAAAHDVDEYLAYSSSFTDGPVVASGKLRAYCDRQ